MIEDKTSISIILSILLFLSILTLFPPVAAAKDRFDCYQKIDGIECKSALIESSECKLGEDEDYEIAIQDEEDNKDVVVLSIHGGLIEPNTSKVSAQLAAEFGWKRYDFSGHATERCITSGGRQTGNVNRDNFRNLHITSSKFNDSDALVLVESNSRTVSIHGYNPERKYDKGLICVGGAKHLEQLDDTTIEMENKQVTSFVKQINNSDNELSLEAIDARGMEKKELCGKLGGTSPHNIVNKNTRKAGLQLELNYKMLEILAHLDNKDYDEYRTVIYKAIEDAVAISNTSESFTAP